MYRLMIGFFASLLTLALAAPALACSPPLTPPVLLVSETSGPDAIGVFYQRNDSRFAPDQLVASLSSAGTEVPGTLSIIEDQNSYRTYLAFTPDEPLAVGTTYEFRIDAEGAEEFEYFESGEEPSFVGDITITESTTPRLGAPAVEWARNATDTNCCSTEEGGCFDSCGSCYSCWPTGYVYRPRLNVEIEAPLGYLVKHTLIVDGVGSSGQTFVSVERPAISAQQPSVLDGSDFKEACLEVEIISPDGEVTTDSKCVDRAAFGDVPNEQVDARDAIAQCVEEPDNTEDIQWKRHKGESKLADEGCSTTSGSPGFGLLLLGLLGLARVRRR